jgi:hypothetical protein
MKKIAVMLTVAAFSLTLGMASAEEGNPWEQKETPPLLKSKNEKQKEVKKEKKRTKKKQKAKKKAKKVE